MPASPHGGEFWEGPPPIVQPRPHEALRCPSIPWNGILAEKWQWRRRLARHGAWGAVQEVVWVGQRRGEGDVAVLIVLVFPSPGPMQFFP